VSSHAERPGQRVIRDRPVVDAPDLYAAGLIEEGLRCDAS